MEAKKYLNDHTRIVLTFDWTFLSYVVKLQRIRNSNLFGHKWITTLSLLPEVVLEGMEAIGFDNIIDYMLWSENRDKEMSDKEMSDKEKSSVEEIVKMLK